MALALDTTLVGSVSNNGSNSPVLSNFSTGGTNRLVLVFGCQSNDAGSISSVTATGLTFSVISALNNATSQGWTEVWGAWAAATQTNVAITVNYAGGNPQSGAMTMCWSGTDATGTVAAAVGVTNKAGSASSNNPSVSLTTTRANSRVVAAVGDIGNTTLTAGSNQTNSSSAGTAGFGKVFDLRQNADTASSGTSVTMNGTLGASHPNGIVAVEIKAPAASTPTGWQQPVNQPAGYYFKPTIVMV